MLLRATSHVRSRRQIQVDNSQCGGTSNPSPRYMVENPPSLPSDGLLKPSRTTVVSSDPPTESSTAGLDMVLGSQPIEPVLKGSVEAPTLPEATPAIQSHVRDEVYSPKLFYMDVDSSGTVSVPSLNMGLSMVGQIQKGKEPMKEGEEAVAHSSNELAMA
ncbi:hypothetical protein ACOSQ3_027800 [Xanthoceras sorbifolium]